MDIQESKIIELSSDHTFCFDCHHRVPCFNECCRDLNQFLTPYDILRLKKSLGISSTDFLEKYAQRHTGPQTGLPVVTLKPENETGRRCPFVSSSGCGIYQDRPASCRIYPLVRAVSRSRRTGTITEKYMLIRETHCQGFANKRKRTVKEWISDQELVPYNEINDVMIEIISAKNQRMHGRLSEEKAELFYTACYDIDQFRNEIFGKRGNAVLPGVSKIPVSVKEDDLSVLKLGMAVAMQIVSE